MEKRKEWKSDVRAEKKNIFVTRLSEILDSEWYCPFLYFFNTQCQLQGTTLRHLIFFFTWNGYVKWESEKAVGRAEVSFVSFPSKYLKHETKAFFSDSSLKKEGR